MGKFLLILCVFFGGGVGSVCRYLIQEIMHERIVLYNFPWATFTVNIVGSLIIGFCYALSEKINLSAEMRLFLTAGFCGGFTTFSTFSNDNLEMLRQGNIVLCLTYIILSIVLGIVACFGGAVLGEKLVN